MHPITSVDRITRTTTHPCAFEPTRAEVAPSTIEALSS